MFLIKIIPPLLGAIVLVLTAVLDYIHRDKRTTRFRQGRLWLFATLGLVLLATPISVFLDDRARDQSAERLNQRLANLVTGGDAFATAVVSPLTKIGGPVVGYNLYIEHGSGDALLYDLRINVFRIHESQSMVWFEGVYTDEIPILTAQTGPLRLGDGSVYGFGDFENIGVMIRQRNGTLRQIIKLIQRGSDYLIAEKALFTSNDGKERIVRESLPAEFRAAGRDQWHFENFETAKAMQPR